MHVFIRRDVADRQHRLVCAMTFAELGLKHPECRGVQHELVTDPHVGAWRPADDRAVLVQRDCIGIIHYDPVQNERPVHLLDAPLH